MMMSRAEADAITMIVCAIRRDWDRSGVLAALTNLRDRDLGDTVIAAVTAATTPSNRTPAVIPLAGPHWPRPSGPYTAAATDRQCDAHLGEPAGNCRCCAADRKAAATEAPSIRAPRERPDTPGRRAAQTAVTALQGTL